MVSKKEDDRKAELEEGKGQAHLQGEDVRFTPLLANAVKGLESTTGSSRMDLAVIAAMERGASTIFLLSDGQPTTSRNGMPLISAISSTFSSKTATAFTTRSQSS